MSKFICTLLLFSSLIFTTNINSQWYPQVVPNDIQNILSISFSNTNYGCAGGWTLLGDAVGRAIYTTDAGTNWKISAIPPNTRVLVTIQKIDTMTFYSAGALNLISNKEKNKTNNFLKNRFDNLPYSIKQYYERIGMNPLDSTLGLFLKSTNRGQSWFAYGNLPGNVVYLEGLYFINSSTGYVTTQKSNLYNNPGILKTTNGGLNWTSQIVPDSLQDIRNILFINSTTGFAVGYGSRSDSVYGVILKTTNAGTNWTQTTANGIENFPAISFTNSSTGFVTASSSSPPAFCAIYKTTNTGLNWSRLPLTIDSIILQGIRFYTGSGIGIIYGTKITSDGFRLYLSKTTDYGSTWREESLNNDEYLPLGSYMLDQTNWYISGLAGTMNFTGFIFHTTTGGDPIGIKPISSEIPKEFSLSQNYPNPFNPTTKIKFSIPLSRGVPGGRGVLVQLIIYDLLGREVATLVNEELKPGTYEVEWNASNYPSGVYFYKLTTESFTNTKRMVLIK